MFEHFGDIGGAEQLLQLLALALPVQPVQHHTHVHALEDDDRSCPVCTIYDKLLYNDTTNDDRKRTMEDGDHDD